MVELLRHRQTKGAATDMFSLQTPRQHLDSTDTVEKGLVIFGEQ